MSHKRIAALVLAVVVVVFAAAGCGGNGSPTIATVGKQKITKAELDQKVSEALGSFDPTAGRKPPKPGTPAYRQLQLQALDYLVQTSQRDQAAADLGVRVTDSMVAGRLDAIKAKSFQGSEKKFEAAIKKADVSISQVKADIRQQLIDEAIQAKLTRHVSVTDAEVKAFYGAHKVQFGQPSTRVVRHILVKTKQQADQLYAQLQHGASFAALAKKNSIDTTSAPQGGKLTVAKGQTVAPFDKVAFSLPTGQIAPPVHSRYGWHIIQALGDTKPAGTMTLAQVASQLKTQLLKSKQANVLGAWSSKIAKQYKVVYAKGWHAPQPPNAAPAPAGK